ncbi:hypothetical protein [Caulobacter sp. 17J65-9]|uniref:hypothetical protein n=1 Tax=Caulobacter sp. 17J65-9 TaxID=2709382 RepID=UPI0013C9F604|nr:hypothetical protein [Caulobacter sp. 17J65-9]NEX91535.1 hypothetical protein [Caulobacter sp. 17J65-9]
MARSIVSALAVAIGLAAAGLAPAAQAAETKTSEPRACPDGLPKDARCFAGQDASGAFYWIAVPANWNGTLVVHAHGGPRTGKPALDDEIEDLQRFAVMVQEGYAWAGSTYRRGGYGVRMAAEDTDNLRKLFWAEFGKPKRTILHGQSWGGNVAAKASELYAYDADGGKNYDGVLLTSGVLAGGTRAYAFRADLRAVYQYYCANHPRPDEPAYPLWRGLPADSKMTRAELKSRVQACTGVDSPAAQRTPEQQRRLSNILAATGVAERQLQSHLAWATFLFQDLVQHRLDGRNPFDNAEVRYRGTTDDKALNAGVQRFSADPAAVTRLAYDADLTGQIALPTLTVHGIDDPVASVRHEAAYRDVVAAAGRSQLLVQTFVDEAEHSQLATPQYAALLRALSAWIETGEKPTPAGVDRLCREHDVTGEGCRFKPDYTPKPLER